MRHNGTILHTEQSEHGMKGREQLQFKSGIVGCAESLRACNPLIKNPGAATGRFFIYYSRKAVNDIRSQHFASFAAGKCIVIVKVHIVPEVKPVYQVIWRDLPGCCQRRNNIQLGIGLNQGIVELMNRPDDGLVLCECRIQCGNSGGLIIPESFFISGGMRMTGGQYDNSC